MKIFVKYLKTFEIFLPKAENTLCNEVFIQAKKIMNIKEDIDLKYAGKFLDKTKYLREIPIPNEATLIILPRLSGGGEGGGSGMGFEFPDITKIKIGCFSDKAPEYRVVCPGLNLDAKCHHCSAQVIVQIGFNEKENDFFDMAKLRICSVCTNCKQKLFPKDVTNAILYRSAWKYEFLFDDSNVPSSGLGYTPFDDKYTYFDEKDENKKMYAYLYIRVIEKKGDVSITGNKFIKNFFQNDF